MRPAVCYFSLPPSGSPCALASKDDSTMTLGFPFFSKEEGAAQPRTEPQARASDWNSLIHILRRRSKAPNNSHGQIASTELSAK